MAVRAGNAPTLLTTARPLRIIEFGGIHRFGSPEYTIMRLVLLIAHIPELVGYSRISSYL